MWVNFFIGWGSGYINFLVFKYGEFMGLKEILK